MKQLGIYIHIPFCKDKCYYCDFVSFKNMEQKQDEYIDCVIKEIESKNWNVINNNYQVTTIYIGGGTPSYIDANNITKILKCLKNSANIINPEITIEVNPGTVNEEKLLKYKNAGINRISIGLQSSNNDLLKQIGRIHTYEQFLESYKLAKKVGFTNINIDLMLGLPNQTIEDLKQSLEKVIELNPSHISVYSLILEEGTVLYKLIEDKKITLPNEELERQMYWYTKNKLELNGYHHYEISNFAKEGKKSKHNVNCWNQEEYLGFGLAAHSYFENKRFSNIENLEIYMQNIKQGNVQKNIEVHEVQTTEEQEKEYMLLGLRKIEGISISRFKEKFIDNPIYLFKDKLKSLVQDGFIEIDGDFIRLTNKGLDFANLVWEEFV